MHFGEGRSYVEQIKENKPYHSEQKDNQKGRDEINSYHNDRGGYNSYHSDGYQGDGSRFEKNHLEESVSSM